MNLICNNCVGARIYELSNKQFNNPFTWCRIDIDDFFKLIEKYDEIDFRNIKVSLEEGQNINMKNKKTILCELDHNIKIHYIHYIFDEKSETTKNNPDVISSDIIGYFNETYNKRTQRMISLNENPTFLFTFNYMPLCEENKKTIERFLNIKNKKICIFSHEDESKNIKSTDNVKIIPFSKNIMNKNGIEFCEHTKHYFF